MRKTEPCTPPVQSQTLPVRLLESGRLRECAGCTACCGPSLTINQPELVKLTGETCPHVGPRGCTQWDTPALPRICRDYFCSYLVEDLPLTRAERPDHVGAIVEHRGPAGTRLVECGPDGLRRVLENAVWGALVRRTLSEGRLLSIAFADDTHGAEALGTRLQADGQLWCRLACTDAQGEPLLTPVQPVHQGRQTYGAVVINDLGFPFPVGALRAYLGRRPRAVLRSSRDAGNTPQVRFLVTRRQIEFLTALEAHLARPMPAAR